MQEIITQKQFLDLYKGGQRAFSNCLMQFFDISSIKIEDVSFSGCDTLFCTFRNCDFRNVIFENCKIYYGSFYSGSANRVEFRKCAIELTLFDNYQFSDVAMNKCNIRISGVFNSNADSIDLATSVQFKFFTNPSQVTQADIEGVIGEVMQGIERMDVGLRMKIKEMIRQDLNTYNLAQPEEKKEKYAASGTNYSDAPLTYGETKGMLESFFYGMNADPYKTKKPYETVGGYKK